MTRLNLVVALVFLVLVLCALAVARAWFGGPLWQQVDLGVVVFTAVSGWLVFAVAITSLDDADDNAPNRAS